MNPKMNLLYMKIHLIISSKDYYHNRTGINKIGVTIDSTQVFDP